MTMIYRYTAADLPDLGRGTLGTMHRQDAGRLAALEDPQRPLLTCRLYRAEVTLGRSAAEFELRSIVSGGTPTWALQQLRELLDLPALLGFLARWAADYRWVQLADHSAPWHGAILSEGHEPLPAESAPIAEW